MNQPNFPHKKTFLLIIFQALITHICILLLLVFGTKSTKYSCILQVNTTQKEGKKHFSIWVYDMHAD